jgi:ribonuclease D
MAAGLDPALIASRAEVTRFVLKYREAEPERHPLLNGWRKAFVGEELLKLLQGRVAVRLDPNTGLPQPWDAI